MDPHEHSGGKPPLALRKLNDQWSWYVDIKRAIYNVHGATHTAIAEMHPMTWGFSWTRGERYQAWGTTLKREYCYDYDTRYARQWWRDRTENRGLHPAVKAVIQDDWVPDCAGGLGGIVLEYPSLSTDMRLAYIQNEDKGRADRWTVTTPGKYIKSRWSYLNDHYIRDVVARTATAAPQIWHKPQDIVRAVQYGPASCMQWDCGDIGTRIVDDWDKNNENGRDFWVRNHEMHPYAVYTHEFGWRMAVRLEGKEIMARALVLHHSRGPYAEGESLQGSVFVRSYRKTGGYSPADETLEAWLQHMGVEKRSGWPMGTKFARVENPQSRYDSIMMPYIDGDSQTVSDEGKYVRLSRHGMLCNNTDGSTDEDNTRTCEHCDEPADADEGITVGYHEDTWVGECCSDNYTLVLGRRRSEYYVHNDNAVNVGGTYYHDEYLSDNDIVELSDGDYCHMDNAFHCPIDDEWYHYDDGIDTEDEGTVHESNAWQCAGSDGWYSTNTDFVLVDGEKYHPDNVPEDEDAEPGSPFDLPYDKPEGSIPNEAQVPLPIVEPEPPKAEEPVVYAHPVTAARGIRYRAGRNDTVDVYQQTGSTWGWHYGVGEPNSNLTGPTCRYYPCPLPTPERKYFYRSATGMYYTRSEGSRDDLAYRFSTAVMEWVVSNHNNYDLDNPTIMTQRPLPTDIPAFTGNALETV